MEAVKVISNTGKEKYKTLISTRNHQIIADEPFDENGQDLGMKPTELLAGALASCTSITLRMYADRKNWYLENIHVEVSFVRDATTNTASFTRNISYTGNLEDAQRDRLLAIANACPVHKVLSGTIVIETALV